ncbi:MAG: transcriptional regulator [Acidobacteria bacterium]|nr:MAG: transcriptional regulator [Acidobacteriota bacterium]
MPIYDYVCDECSHQLEALQGINEAPLVHCPNCHTNRLRKKITAPAFAFKGGGWYKDLYSSSKSSSTAKSPAPAKPVKTTKEKSA